MTAPRADRGHRAGGDSAPDWSDDLTLDEEACRVSDLASNLEFLQSGSFINPLLYSTSPVFLRQLKLVAAELGATPESPAWNVLLSITVNLVRDWQHGHPSVVSLRRGDHPVPARYLLDWWREDAVRRVVDDLLRCGFIFKVPGSTKTHQATRIWPTPKLSSLLPKISKVERWPDPELLELRVPREVLDDDDDQDDGVRLKAYQEHSTRIAMRHRLEQVNALLSRTRLGLLPGHGLPPKEVEAFNSAPHSLRRIFNGKWTAGGRHYTRGSWQTLRRQVRRHLLIDGRQTVEIDYTGLHIAMAYALAGIQLQGDPHAIPDVDRLLAKRMGVIALNAKSRGKAIAGFTKKVHDKRENGEWRDGELHDCYAGQSLRPKEIYEAFVAHHPRIARYVGSGIGLKLQFRDSQIMSEILRRLTNEGIAALPVHDSVIVQMRHADLLEQVMLEEYEREMGYTIEVKRKPGLPVGHSLRRPGILHSRPGRNSRRA